MEILLRVLDGPRLLVDGEPATLPESSLRILVFLAFRRRPAPRRVVASLLWPDSDEARAGGNMRSALWRLRAVGVPIDDRAGTGLHVRPGLAVDLDAVTGWAGRVAAGPGEPSDLRVPAGVDAALDLLPAWYDDWVIFERERVRACVLHALEQVSERLSECGRHAEAVDAAIAAVCAEPLRESAQRALILAHLAEGNQIEAHRSYRAYRTLLETELGVAPSPQLRALAPVAVSH
ncbi:SARP family transcriptional regulator [Nonomuraea sp. PA05]|uniref:AfsR/SARP family transcriptional regulator n=1 Tax=Nonomuraea sp. PA05 TaxID=2604466 RepID=UPI0011D45BE7|nr:BTAD domain-containing putative transcriptional regulator [Nonomuraea sp. PA05]TYB64811.1 SARP family transcriptional regulator [Nonomuraea sp. PA05]